MAAVGPATAEALRAEGVSVALMPAERGSGASLAARFPPARAGEMVLLPRSDLAAADLPEALNDKGFRVVPVTAYRTLTRSVPTSVVHELAAGAFDAVLLTSPSTVAALAGLEIARGTMHGRDRLADRRSLRSGGAQPALHGRQSHSRRTCRRLDRCRGHPPPDREMSYLMPGSFSAASFPAARPRRLRRTPAIRRLVAQTRLHPADLVLPMFVKESLTEPSPLNSMPGVLQHTRDSLRAAAVQAVSSGVGGLMIFGIPSDRDAIGSQATDPDGILNVALADLRKEVGADTVLMADLCLDEFTDHGHCGVLSPTGAVDNDATLQRYREMAVAQAESGADFVGTSGMMDGQVGAVRAALDGAGFADTAIFAYAAKYASAFYGPFREAVDSALIGDRRSYQQDPANRREAAREVALDIAEGADLVMVKPAMAYLDVLADVAGSVDVPVAAYQVSGEYAMIEAAAANGWIDRDRAIAETLTAIRRAGAQIVLTYWAADVAARLTAGEL